MIQRGHQRLDFILRALQPILKEAAECCCDVIHEQGRSEKDWMHERIRIMGFTSLLMGHQCQGHLLLMAELFNIVQDFTADEGTDAQEAGQPPN